MLETWASSAHEYMRVGGVGNMGICSACVLVVLETWASAVHVCMGVENVGASVHVSVRLEM